jgi:exonuclease VII small subunit
MTLEEAVERYEGRNKLIYKGIPLKDYCRQNKLNYGAIQTLRRRKKISLEEAVKLYEEGKVIPKKLDIEGKSLKEYCKELGIEDKYRCILMYRKNHNCTIEKAIERYI